MVNARTALRASVTLLCLPENVQRPMLSRYQTSYAMGSAVGSAVIALALLLRPNIGCPFIVVSRTLSTFLHIVKPRCGVSCRNSVAHKKGPHSRRSEGSFSLRLWLPCLLHR